MTTDTQTEARAIAQKLQDVVDGTDGWLNVDKATDIIATALEAQAAELAEVKVSNNKWLAKWERAEAELAEVKSKCQALDDECQQSMLDISRERDRAERASALLAEWIEQWAVVKDQLDAYRQSSVHPDDYEAVKAQLAEANKALDAVFEDTQARTKAGMTYGINSHPTLSPATLHIVAQVRFSARRALEAQGGEDVL